MSAGLPGLGLGGLFFILSALLGPVVELVRTLRGQSSPAAWRAVGRQFALALTMIAAVELTLRLMYLLVEGAGLGGSPPGDSATVLPLRPIAITLGLLACVLGTAKAMHLVASVRARGWPSRLVVLRPPARRHLLAGSGAALVAWAALLTAGAPDLGPPADSGAASEPIQRPGTPSTGVFDRGARSGRSPDPAAEDRSGAAVSERRVELAGSQRAGSQRADAPAQPLSPQEGGDGIAVDAPESDGGPSVSPSSPAPAWSTPSAPELPVGAPAPPTAGGPPPGVVPPPAAGPPSDTGGPAGAGPPADVPARGARAEHAASA